MMRITSFDPRYHIRRVMGQTRKESVVKAEKKIWDMAQRNILMPIYVQIRELRILT